ncbi:MAG TPA: protein translocase subunit SecD [Syntrophales bacterium]|nr:protein translocase subunit SecD [Syntrophales bacterium]HQG35385.1 protein translocase subunit SecD [Syntrophales bacterium]HQI36771.1 protein translocase subunit SecD [Syntrophales bacterium]HQJ31129.1 protein translocase subunit SecD [Syntrophales bacterium]HRR48038.1 protein translocase subunit SecD [Syntrophales bacterium]
MIKSIGIRALIVLVVCLAALFYLTPSLLTDSLPAFWKKNLPADKIHLGLDLQGGMHLVLEVQTDKALEGTIERISNDIKETMMEKKIRFRSIARTHTDAITLEFPDHPAREAFEKILKDNYPDFEATSTTQREGREIVQIKLKVKRAQEIKKLAMEQGLETIRNRVDQFGITEPEIIPQGEDRIIVQLPGIRDPGRAKNLIGKTALLEFKLLDEEHSLEEAMRGNIPEGSVVAYGTRLDPESGRRTQVPYLVKNKALMTGASLETAKVSIGDRFGEPYVSLKFNAQGAQDFDRITGENVKKRLAIVLDGVIHSAPVIQERISGGNAQITGNFTLDEAKDLAIVLRAGALPAPVTILEERTVGPSLGQDSIDKGLWSTIVGGLLVVLFMMVYYKLSGLVANFALLLNIIIIFGALAAFRATLTLPGIAGIVLVIGMAVDANVLIFERIREEMRTGKTPRAAIDAGYGKAFLTILDSNVTTLIAALFLFGFGTGPVKGFAVTLTIGIIASMFTAIFVTRIVFDYFVWNRKIQSISI